MPMPAEISRQIFSPCSRLLCKHFFERRNLNDLDLNLNLLDHFKLIQMNLNFFHMRLRKKDHFRFFFPFMTFPLFHVELYGVLSAFPPFLPPATRSIHCLPMTMTADGGTLVLRY